MAVLPGKTWGMAQPLLPNKNHLSSGCDQYYERDIGDGTAHVQLVAAKQRRSTKFCPCSPFRLVTLRLVREVALC
jgi:hypothetical protein